MRAFILNFSQNRNPHKYSISTLCIALERFCTSFNKDTFEIHEATVDEQRNYVVGYIEGSIAGMEKAFRLKEEMLLKSFGRDKDGNVIVIWLVYGRKDGFFLATINIIPIFDANQIQPVPA